MKVFTFSANVWLYPGDAAWHFVTVPKEASAKIAAGQAGKERRGWGAVKVRSTIGGTSWETSIFPDKKSGCYLLPLKTEVRKKEGVFDKEEVRVALELK